MTLLLALIYLAAGILCINRPSRIAEWIGKALLRSGNAGRQKWLKGRGMIFFIRLLGFLALVNAVMLLYTAQYS